MSKLETAFQQSPLQNGLQNGRDLTPLQASAYDFESLTSFLPQYNKSENNEGVLNFEPIYSNRDSNLASAAVFKDEFKTIKREDGVDVTTKTVDGKLVSVTLGKEVFSLNKDGKTWGPNQKTKSIGIIDEVTVSDDGSVTFKIRSKANRATISFCTDGTLKGEGVKDGERVAFTKTKDGQYTREDKYGTFIRFGKEADVIIRPKTGGEIRVDFETRKIQATFSDGVRKEYDNLTDKEISGLMKADVVQVVFKLDHPNDPAFKKQDPANKHRWNWRF